LDREHDFNQFVKTLAGASIVISSRLHLFLIASFLGVETKVYPYQKKILKMQKIVQDLF
jgi:polysaccharide pyruvyl transferase WcaK-like protein